MVLCTKVCSKNIALSTPVLGYKPSRDYIEAPTYGLLLKTTTPEPVDFPKSTAQVFSLVITHPVIILIHQGLTVVNIHKPLSPFVASNCGSFICVFSLQFPMHFGAWLFYTWEKIFFFFHLSLGINMKKTINQLYTR